MLFNSISFAVFLIAVFTVYWMLGRQRKLQNLFLLIASYIFYGWWDWRYLFLIAGCSLVNFIAGQIIFLSKSRLVRHLSLTICCVLCLAALCYFKYFNFFVESFAEILKFWDINWNPLVLNVMLPVGISFFTFQALSYTIDIALGKLKPTNDFVEFFVFISFFPQLVAGPIERASNLLPQFQKERKFEFNEATQGLVLIAYGLFKKMVVADTLALYVDRVFSVPEIFSSVTCILGAFFFSIQIYCDFSGYSDCARGVARLFGFKLMLNFNRPYITTSFIDFWRHWHISLSTWFKDYVYIPLGGNRKGLVILIRNVWIVFLLSGLWHGASWTFIMWGILHALYQTIDLLWRRFVGEIKTKSIIIRIVSIFIVNIGVVFAWIFFRAGNVNVLYKYLKALFFNGFSTTMMGLCAGQGPMIFCACIASIFLLAISYLFPRDCEFCTTKGKFLFTAACAAAIIFLGQPTGGEFIYFQF